MAKTVQIPTKENVTLEFPLNITSNQSLKNKRMYITIYKASPMENIEEMLKKTYEAGKDAVSDVIDMNFSTALENAEKIAKEITEFRGTEELTIALPLPNELSDSQSHNFSTGEGVAHTLLNAIPGFDTANNIVGKAAAATSNQRVLANPGFFQNYTGSDPRSFSFSFKMIPNSREEADTIINIINTLKKASSPTITLQAFLTAPRFFWFWFSNETLMKLTNIQPAIIKSVAVDYGAGGQVDVTMDGMPKFINLTLEITELRAITAEQW